MDGVLVLEKDESWALGIELDQGEDRKARNRRKGEQSIEKH